MLKSYDSSVVTSNENTYDVNIDTLQLFGVISINSLLVCNEFLVVNRGETY